MTDNASVIGGPQVDNGCVIDYSKVDPADVCFQAADILLVDGWCQGTLHDERGRHCFYGAVEKVLNLGGDDRFRHEYDGGYFIRDTIGAAAAKYLSLGSRTGVPTWNDRIAESSDQVIDVLRAVGKSFANGEITYTYTPPEPF